MGLAMLANQAFSSIDVMILGYLADSTQTGLYSAAYRMFLLVLAIYYLVMQALYPQLAAIPMEQRNFRTLQPYMKRIGLAGIGITILMELIRKPLIGILYGSAFVDAERLAVPILLAIPLELVASFLLTAIIAWGESRTALAATVTAGLCNVVLNFRLIPRFGAMGASYATPLSYAVFLLVLLLCLWKPLRPSNVSDMKLSTPFN
jgi:O-antigen/teichoic acid export membrane protein